MAFPYFCRSIRNRRSIVMNKGLDDGNQITNSWIRTTSFSGGCALQINEKQINVLHINSTFSKNMSYITKNFVLKKEQSRPEVL
jgi:hypothetical protein